MSRKYEPADSSRDFVVRYCEWGAWINGFHAPADDVSALLKAWAYRGYRFLSLAVAKELECLVAVCEHAGDEMSWLEELSQERGSEESIGEEE